jgi:predicted ATPase
VPECSDFEQWLLTEREQWQLRMGQIFQSVIKHHLERGEYDQGLRHVTRLLELTPWQEEAHRQKMQLLYLSGQRSAALTQFDICTQILAYELGVEPAQETVDLAAQIQGLSRALAPTNQRQIIQPTLYERGDEHFWLTQQWQEARRGLGKFTLVEGEAGVGKSVLMDEVLAYAVSHGTQALRARCYDYNPGMTYEALVSALRPLFRSDSPVLVQTRLAQPWLVELSRLWPEIQQLIPSPPPLPEEETSARHRLFEAIAQLLEQTAQTHGEMILFLDDLHNSDQPTLDLLRYLYHRLHNRAIWFVAAYRREEITPNHPLNLLRNVLIREGVLVEITLYRLSGETIYHVVQSYGGLTRTESQQLTRYLLQESQGNPFVLEQVQTWLQEGEILQEEEGRWHLDQERFGLIPQDESGSIPLGVRAMLENRLARLSQRARRLLQTAGVIGQQFDLGTLLKASGEPTDWVEICLASWMARGFIQEIPAASTLPAAQHRYRFSHIMLWRVILAELTPLQRQRLEEGVRG